MKENERNTRLANKIPFNKTKENERNTRDGYTVNISGTNSINFEQASIQCTVKENERNIRLDHISNHNGHYFRTGYGKEFSCSGTPSQSSDFNRNKSRYSTYQEPIDAKLFPKGK